MSHGDIELGGCEGPASVELTSPATQRDLAARSRGRARCRRARALSAPRDSRADAEEDVGLGIPELSEASGRHLLVVVLPGMDEDETHVGSDDAERRVHGRYLHEVGSRADDEKDGGHWRPLVTRIGPGSEPAGTVSG